MPRRPTQNDYARMCRSAYRKTNRILQPLLNGKITVDEWGDRFSTYLEERHIAAGYLGRRRGGDFSPFNEDDVEFGQIIADEQVDFLLSFMQDLKDNKARYVRPDGTYNPVTIRRRARMYIQRLLGTANEAFTATLDTEDMVEWRRRASESCEDCIRLSREGPYKADSLRTYPGNGSTQCKVNCKCYLYVTNRRLSSFKGV